LSLYCYFGSDNEVWTQGLILARQALCHLNHNSVLIALVIFQIDSYFFCLGQPGWQSSYLWLSYSLDDKYISPYLAYWLTWDLNNFLPGWALNNLCFPSSWHYRCEPPHPPPPHLLLLLLVVVGIELRVLHLLGKCSTTWTTLLLLFLRGRSCFVVQPGRKLLGLSDPPASAFWSAGITDTYN
jgi:hypothetical protein